MNFFRINALAVVGVIGLGIVSVDPAYAKPGRGNGHGQNQHPVPAEVVEADETDAILTRDRVEAILDIIYGTDADTADLISDELRLEILADLDSLPPGIQQRLERGRGLPPGIAKKYRLPARVLTLLDLESDTELLIIGDNILIVNPTNIVLDLVESVL